MEPFLRVGQIFCGPRFLTFQLPVINIFRRLNSAAVVLRPLKNWKASLWSAAWRLLAVKTRRAVTVLGLITGLSPHARGLQMWMAQSSEDVASKLTAHDSYYLLCEESSFFFFLLSFFTHRGAVLRHMSTVML